MHVDNQKVCAVYRKVQLLREHLIRVCPGPQEPALRIMDLHYVVQDMYQLKIDMFEVSFQAVYLKGKVERYSNGYARVLVRANLSDAEKRSTAVKELCHLVIDEQEDWSPAGCDTLDALLLDATMWAADGIGHKEPTRPLASEALAILAAMELMYPGDYQDADIAKLQAGETTISAIAMQHDVPPYIIEHALKNKPLRDRIHAQIEAEISGQGQQAAE